MAIKIRLTRGGSKKRPFYRVVAADSRMPRDGRFIEKLGTYNPLLPKDNPERIKIDVDKIKVWISKGAQPTDRILRILEDLEILPKKIRNNPKKGLQHKSTVERNEKKLKAKEEENSKSKIDVSKVEENQKDNAAEQSVVPNEDNKLKSEKPQGESHETAEVPKEKDQSQEPVADDNAEKKD